MKSICFLGFGLIGGSIAKSLIDAKDYPCSLSAYDPDTRSLEQAVRDHVLQASYHHIDDVPLEQADIIILCAPVMVNSANLRSIRDRIPADCIVTDVGSVKSDIVKCVAELGLTDRFIGGHPMTGSEKNGYIASSALLMRNAYYILTPTENIPRTFLDEMLRMVKATGALPLVMGCSEHDQVVAGISHLPHLISASLVNLIHDNDVENEYMHKVAAGGFKDITRISSSSPRMWEQICAMNTGSILPLLDQYIRSLCDLRDHLEHYDKEYIYDFFSNAREYRASFSDLSHGPIRKLHRLYVDIPDVPGIIAKIASLLALHGINIQNIGIIHNREFENGALRIEFREESDMQEAAGLLRNADYSISLPLDTK